MYVLFAFCTVCVKCFSILSLFYYILILKASVNTRFEEMLVTDCFVLCHIRIHTGAKPYSFCLSQAVVAAETVAEFKRKLSNVDLSSFLRYNFNTQA